MSFFISLYQQYSWCSLKLFKFNWLYLDFRSTINYYKELLEHGKTYKIYIHNKIIINFLNHIKKFKDTFLYFEYKIKSKISFFSYKF